MIMEAVKLVHILPSDFACYGVFFADKVNQIHIDNLRSIINLLLFQHAVHLNYFPGLVIFLPDARCRFSNGITFNGYKQLAHKIIPQTRI